MRIQSATGFCVLSLLVLSCQRDEPRPLVPAAGTIRAVERAVEDISTTRCEHEQRCKQIGSDMRYSDQQHCMSVMRSEARQSLSQCQAGLDHDDLRECLTQIENQDCDGPVSGLAEYKECRLDDLCD